MLFWLKVFLLVWLGVLVRSVRHPHGSILILLLVRAVLVVATFVVAAVFVHDYITSIFILRSQTKVIYMGFGGKMCQPYRLFWVCFLPYCFVRAVEGTVGILFAVVALVRLFLVFVHAVNSIFILVVFGHVFLTSALFCVSKKRSIPISFLGNYTRGCITIVRNGPQNIQEYLQGLGGCPHRF